MNRDRRLSCVNGYSRELGLNPLDALTSLLAGGSDAKRGTLAAAASKAGEYGFESRPSGHLVV
jgi:hypothetical protein